MTKDETNILIKRIQSLYMAQARQYTDSDWLTMAGVWYDQFKDESYEDVNKALTIYVNKGKSFIPNVADIINELLNLDEPHFRKLFEILKRECDIVANGKEHVVIDDLGGIRRDPTSPTGFRFVTAEAHGTDKYTQQDFANLPMELQIYAEDIKGLEALHKEILSNEIYAYRRFRDHIPSIQQEMKGA